VWCKDFTAVVFSHFHWYFFAVFRCRNIDCVIFWFVSFDYASGAAVVFIFSWLMCFRYFRWFLFIFLFDPAKYFLRGQIFWLWLIFQGWPASFRFIKYFSCRNFFFFLISFSIFFDKLSSRFSLYFSSSMIFLSYFKDFIIALMIIVKLITPAIISIAFELFRWGPLWKW